MRIASVKSLSARGASHQPALIAWLLDWSDGGSVDILLNGKYAFTSMGSWCYSME